MHLLQWSSSHSILSECRWLREPELIPKFLIIHPAGRIRSARSVSEHARPNEMSPRGALCWAIGGKPGLLIISNSSLASLQTKCHLVPTGGVWGGSLTRWQSKQQSGNRKCFTSKDTFRKTHSFQQSSYKLYMTSLKHILLIWYWHFLFFHWTSNLIAWLMILICTWHIISMKSSHQKHLNRCAVTHVGLASLFVK